MPIAATATLPQGALVCCGVGGGVLGCCGRVLGCSVVLGCAIQVIDHHVPMHPPTHPPRTVLYRWVPNGVTWAIRLRLSFMAANTTETMPTRQRIRRKHQVTCSLARSLTHPLNHSPTRPLAHSLRHPFCPSSTRSVPHSTPPSSGPPHPWP